MVDRAAKKGVITPQNSSMLKFWVKNLRETKQIQGKNTWKTRPKMFKRSRARHLSLNQIKYPALPYFRFRGMARGLRRCSSVTFACEQIGEAHADTSSIAVEIYGAGNATQNILGLSYVIEEMGMEFPFPFKLEMDNAAAKIFCLGSALKTKLKHIDCR